MLYQTKINEKISYNSYNSKAWAFYTEDLSLGFLDIETTGLSSKQNCILLGGLLPDNPALSEAPLTTMQYFAETPSEEADLLDKYITALSNHDIWISYNGDSFDFPFLIKRMQRLGVRESLPFHQSFDLYRILRQFSPITKLLPDLKQKTVETFLGIHETRTDQISGKESALMYENYLQHTSFEAKQAILLHNQDDLSQLYRLLVILNKLNLHQIMFYRGFITAHEEKRMKIERIYFDKNILSVTGITKNISLPYQSFATTYQANLSSAAQTFELRIPFLSEKNYIFLDLEPFHMDFSSVEKYGGFQSGYLILHDGKNPNYLEINHALKIILKQILKQF